MLASIPKSKSTGGLIYLTPLPKKVFRFRAVFNDYTGYGLHACYIVRSFLRFGYDVRALPLRLPKDEKREWMGRPEVLQVIQENTERTGNELILSFVDARVDREQWLYTMYETTQMPRKSLDGINQARALIVPSIWCQQNFNAQGVKIPMYVVPLGVNLDLFAPVPKSSDLCVFGTAGNVSLSVPIRKNIDVVTTAFREAFPKETDVRLRIKVQADCPVAMSDDDRVEVIRQSFTEEAMAEWFQSLTAYISTSHAEAFGQMNVQAMACGVPTICCAFGGVLDYHSEHHGYNIEFTLARPVGCYHELGLWADPDLDSLIAQMRRVYENRREAAEKGAAARQVAERYDWDTMNRKLEGVLKETDFWDVQRTRKRLRPKGVRMMREIQFEPFTHRAGWNAVLSYMNEAIHDPNSPVMLDDYIEKNFCWDWYTAVEAGTIPYRKPWVGFVHNPIHTPYPFDIKSSTGVIFSSGHFVESLNHCLGIYTLSEALARDVRKLLDGQVPVQAFLHPTEFTDKLFDPDRYLKKPRILHIGWWLRKFSSFALLPVTIPKYGVMAQDKFPRRITEMKRDMSLLAINQWSKYKPTEITYLDYLTNEDYDDWLASSVVFLDLYSSSANNAVIECIVRNTPVLVNPIDAVVEYLGPEYPFYYHSLEEAAEKATTDWWIRLAHEYLLNWKLKEELRYEHFIDRIRRSEIMKRVLSL